MIEDSVQPAAELAAVLLEAKLAVPLDRPGSVSRYGLIERARSSACRVVAVTAPAGYGKSTLLTQWANIDGRRVAWVSLDRLDDDPSALLSVLAAAFARISGHDDLMAGAAGLALSALGRAAPRLASAVRTSDTPFVLMLDDLQEIRSPDCHDVLEVVLAAVPPGSQVVAASRSAQPHVARLRVQGQTMELGPADLALNPEEAQQVFAGAQLHLPIEVAEVVTTRTEGWPVGVYLAAVIAAENGGETLGISGDDRYVADYLYRESLLQLPPEVQHFLRCTAVLDQLHPPLCDALLQESGSEGRLRDLEASSQFLVPLDRRRHWFRYHALFREFLLGELRRVDPDLVVTLHLRAADWYEANGSPALALEHLLQTSDLDRCVQLAARLALPTYQSGQQLTVHRWLSTLGDATVASHPPLAVQAAWLAALTGHPLDADRWAASVDTATHGGPPVDGTASFASARALLRALLCRRGPRQMFIDASFATSAEPPWSRWRAMALILSAEAQLLLGDRGRARRLFVETHSVAAVLGNVNNMILSAAELSLLAMDDGRWQEARHHLDLAMITLEAEQLDDYVTSVMTFVAAARLAVHDGDRAEANRQLVRAMRTRPASTFALPYLAVRSRIQLARVHASLADRTAARHLLHEIDDILRHRPDLGTVVAQVADLRKSLALNTDATMTAGTPLSPAELRVLPYLQTHLTFPEIAERLFVSKNTISTQVRSIYRKLGTSTRNETVTMATAVGLLGG